MSIQRSATVVAASASLLFALSGEAAATEYYYTILGPDGPVFRHVIEDPAAACVNATVVGGSRRGELGMNVRFRGANSGDRKMWPITVCETTLTYAEAAGATRVSLMEPGPDQVERAFPLPASSPQKIAVIGDTGCKVKIEKVKHKGEENEVYVGQNCKDHDKWPLKKIADHLADSADLGLVIHVGDFIYRKARCPSGKESECGDDSPWGTQWRTLKAEILDPTVRLQKKAPWVVARGNHENCDASKPLQAQGGIGFFILVDPRPLGEVTDANLLDAYLRKLSSLTSGKGDRTVPSACDEKTDPYIVPVDADLELWVLDSNEPEDNRTHAKTYNKHDEHSPTLIEKFVKDFKALSASSQRSHRFLVTHRPIYGLLPGKRKLLLKDDGSGDWDPEKVERARLEEQNVTLQEAFGLAKNDGMERHFDLAITAHNHVTQWVAVEGLPPNITVGNSGTALDSHFALVPRLVTITGRYKVGLGANGCGVERNVTGFTISDEFGYTMLRKVVGWTAMSLHQDDGKTLAECSSLSGRWTCTKL